MTPEERRSLAEQITANPLFNHILSDMEQRAIQRLIVASKDDIATAQLRVQAIQQFRADLGQALSTPTRKAAPA